MISRPSAAGNTPEGAAMGLSLPTRGAWRPVIAQPMDKGEAMAAAQSIMAMSM